MLEDDIKNRYRTLIFIQYEVFDGKSVEEAFKSFCKVLGNNLMEYHEFEYWYYRFKNENYDLDHDRSKDPKKPELMDIPLEIVEMIIRKLTLEEKLVLRNVSKTVRNVVDNMKSTFDDCYLFIDNRDDYYSVRVFNSGNYEEVKWKSWKKLLKDFVTMMNWPKVKWEFIEFSINIDLNEQDTTLFLEAFKSLNHQIPVWDVCIFPYAGKFIDVFPYVKPGFLEKIYIFGEDDYFNFNEIVKSDQWKQAKHCEIHLIELSIESNFHFETITVFVSKMSVDDVRKLKNALFASPNFEYCEVTIYNEDDEDGVRNAFEDEIIPIPGTNQLFKYEFDGEDYFSFAFMKTTA